ncbi:MAG: hypothetical protein ABSD31_13675 [Candidatus Binataceae bacterium]|jgi:hypothetical protein
MPGPSNSIDRAKHGGDHSSRAAHLRARENEQKALALWLKGATFEQIAAAGFSITTASGAWRACRRALARIPKEEADQARTAQLARLQSIRLHLWNNSAADPIRAAEALIRLDTRESKLLGLDAPQRAEVSGPDGGPVSLLASADAKELEIRLGRLTIPEQSEFIRLLNVMDGIEPSVVETTATLTDEP